MPGKVKSGSPLRTVTLKTVWAKVNNSVFRRPVNIRS